MPTKFVRSWNSFEAGNQLIDYVHLFKAISEGKTLQVNKSYTSVPHWKDLETVAFDSPVENYRVKPEPEVHDLVMEMFAHPSCSNLGWYFYSPNQSGYSEDIPSLAKLYRVELKLTEIIKG